jgi:hypothetical protein
VALPACNAGPVLAQNAQGQVECSQGFAAVAHTVDAVDLEHSYIFLNYCAFIVKKEVNPEYWVGILVGICEHCIQEMCLFPAFN